MYLMREETEAPLLRIGEALGGRDHSTILHGCEKIEREMGENDDFRRDINSLASCSTRSNGRYTRLAVWISDRDLWIRTRIRGQPAP